MTATAKCLLLNYWEKKWFKLRPQWYFFKSLVTCFCLQRLLWVVELKTFEKKICCRSLWQSTLLNKCKEVTSSHFFYIPIGWSLLQPISTNNPDLGGVASSVCFFLRTFLRRHFAGMASRNVGCYRRLYLSRFPVVVIVFLLSFLFALLADVTFAFLCFYRNRQRTQTHWPKLSWICWLISLVGQIKKQKVS